MVDENKFVYYHTNMIILGNVLSVFVALVTGAIAFVSFLGTGIWDDPGAGDYPLPVVGIFVTSILFIVFVIISIIFSHSRHSRIWAWAPVGVGLLIGLVLLGLILSLFGF